MVSAPPSSRARRRALPALAGHVQALVRGDVCPAIRGARGANAAEFKGCLQLGDPPHAVVLRVLLSTFWAVLLASAAAAVAAAACERLLFAPPSCSPPALSSPS